MRKAILSKKTISRLEKLLVYLETEWGERAKQKFIKKLDKSIKFVTTFPEATEKSELMVGLHRCVVTKQTTFYYKFNDTEIHIVALFDNRMNPEKLKNEIK